MLRLTLSDPHQRTLGRTIRQEHDDQHQPGQDHHRALGGVAWPGREEADEHRHHQRGRAEVPDEHRGADDLAPCWMIHDVLRLDGGESRAAERRSSLERRNVRRQARGDQRTRGHAGEGHRQNGNNEERRNCIHRPMFPCSRRSRCVPPRRPRRHRSSATAPRSHRPMRVHRRRAPRPPRRRRHHHRPHHHPHPHHRSPLPRPRRRSGRVVPRGGRSRVERLARTARCCATTARPRWRRSSPTARGPPRHDAAHAPGTGGRRVAGAPGPGAATTSALVVSSCVVASRSRTSARVSGHRSASASTRSSIAVAFAQKSGASSRTTTTPSTGRRSGWPRTRPHAAFSSPILPSTSIRGELAR